MTAHSDAVPFSQEEIDTTCYHLMQTEITEVAVARFLRKMDDIEDGAGNLPMDWRPHCHKCGEEFGVGEMMGSAFGNFYHDRCVPDLSTGPMPVGQFLYGGGLDP